jgi:low affinity Fe/Cu permease
MPRDRNAVEEAFARVAEKTSQATGSFWAFGLAVITIVIWSATGPIFGFSDTWQLVINTGTTIITFLMVFVIQHAQNKDTRALHLKLNEIIAALEGASNRLIDVEELTDAELLVLHERYRRLAVTARKLLDGAKLSIDDDNRKPPVSAEEA